MSFLAPLTLALSTTLIAGAVDGAPNPGAHKSPIERVCQSVQCTAKQRQELREIGADLKEAVTPKRRAIKQLRREVAAEYRKNRPSQARMNQLTKRIAAARNEIAASVNTALMDAHKILTPNQRAKVADHMARVGPRKTFKGKQPGRTGKKGKKAKKAKS